MLTASARDVLIEHMDGRQVEIKPIGQGKGGANRNVIYGLCSRGFLAYLPVIRPTHTIITDLGRQALARALADWADAISRVNDSVDQIVMPGIGQAIDEAFSSMTQTGG